MDGGNRSRYFYGDCGYGSAAEWTGAPGVSITTSYVKK